MGRCFSEDLRERIVAKIDAGHSRRAAGRYFGVSESCAIKLKARSDETGSVAPARQGRPPGGGKLAPHLAFLIARVKEKPGITMPELAVELEAERGVSAHPASVSRVLRKAGYTYKKIPDRKRTGASRYPAQAPGMDHSAPTTDAPPTSPSGIH